MLASARYIKSTDAEYCSTGGSQQTDVHYGRKKIQKKRCYVGRKRERGRKNKENEKGEEEGERGLAKLKFLGVFSGSVFDGPY